MSRSRRLGCGLREHPARAPGAPSARFRFIGSDTSLVPPRRAWMKELHRKADEDHEIAVSDCAATAAGRATSAPVEQGGELEQASGRPEESEERRASTAACIACLRRLSRRATTPAIAIGSPEKRRDESGHAGGAGAEVEADTDEDRSNRRPCDLGHVPIVPSYPRPHRALSVHSDQDWRSRVRTGSHAPAPRGSRAPGGPVAGRTAPR